MPNIKEIAEAIEKRVKEAESLLGTLEEGYISLEYAREWIDATKKDVYDLYRDNKTTRIAKILVDFDSLDYRIRKLLENQEDNFNHG